MAPTKKGSASTQKKAGDKKGKQGIPDTGEDKSQSKVMLTIRAS